MQAFFHCQGGVSKHDQVAQAVQAARELAGEDLSKSPCLSCGQPLCCQTSECRMFAMLSQSVTVQAFFRCHGGDSRHD